MALVALNLFVIFLAGYTVRHGYVSHTERARVAADNVAFALQHNISDTFASADRALLALIDEYQRQLRNGRIDRATLTAFIDRTRSRLPAIGALHITDTQGVLRYGTGVAPDSRLSLADRPHFARLRDDPAAGLVFSKVIAAPATGGPMLALVRRIDHAGAFAGMAAVTVPLDVFASQFDAIELGTYGVAALRDAHFAPLLRHPRS
ncbi:MAG: hypothetical protein OEW36_07595, partial [Hylemonella sp.]|nr:hypothetical protein [Hylemonella sp.]